MDSTGIGGAAITGGLSGDAGSPLVGTLLDDRYRLDSVIARGGMATVFVATDTRLDRGVAVKVMHRALAEDPEFVARFTREAKSTARLSAGEVVAVHDYGTDRSTGLAYLVMEHIRGINLRQLVVDRGPLPPARAVALLEPVLRALAAAHAAGLVHRDIKPENVLLADDGRVKVADFGLARAVETSNLTQTTGLLIGTVAYLAPEQVESGTADARSDVYAAGVLLWELLTGTPPYSGDSPLSVAYKHVHEDMPAPSTAIGGIPPLLDALVVRATRRDPAARPPDGGAFLAELRDVARTLPSVAVSTAGSAPAHQTLMVERPPTVPQRERKSRRGLIATALLLVLALLALGTGYYLGEYRYTKSPGVLKHSLVAAEQKLKEAGLTMKQGPQRFSDAVREGQVLDQDPDPGAKVRKGGAVTVFLSKGPRTVLLPSLFEKTVAEATQILTDRGLKATTRRDFSESVDRDLVVRSEPKAGSTVRTGTTVTLVVSKGQAPVRVPNVLGKTRAEADRLLSNAGFDMTVSEAFSDEVPAGLVISQSPAGGGTRARGSRVAITLSKGPDVVRVPDVRGDKVDRAVSELEALGFKTTVRRAFPGGPSRVLDTDPNPGEKAPRGSTIVVKIF